jgi:hypothetical protein
VALEGSYTTTDGQSHATADVWFLADKDVSANVANLAQSMASFNAGAAAPATGGQLSMPAPAAGVAAAVTRIADVLGQYDADGKLLGSSGLAASDKDALKLKGLDNTATGFLATPAK